MKTQFICILTLLFISISSTYSQTKTKEPQKAQKVERSKDRAKLFGIILGATKKSELMSVEGITYESENYGIVTSGGKFIEFDSKDIPELGLSAASIVLEGEGFEATFINDVLFELRVKAIFDNEDMVNEIRKSFASKYKKMNPIRTTNNQPLMERRYLYETWSEKSGDFLIQLREETKFVHNESACLNIVSYLPITYATIDLKRECYRVTDGEKRYRIIYTEPSIASRAFSALVKAKDNKKKANSEAERKSIKKF